MRSERRYLFYADFLGTTEGYLDLDGIRFQRGVLERAVRALILPTAETHDVYAYIASDSLFVCCPRLEHLLTYAARLFGFYLSSTSTQPRLRGAISYGRRAESHGFADSPRAKAIPLLDDSLPRVMKLEKIRKGSRIYLDPNIPTSATRQHQSHILHWESITGNGPKEGVNNIKEFLWPRLACGGKRELLKYAVEIGGAWSEGLRKKRWEEVEYGNGIMIQLDETLKLFIRSLANVNSDPDVKRYLYSLLPRTIHHEGQVFFEWGIWFQAIKALCKPSEALTNQLKDRIKLVKQVLQKSGHLGHFHAELEERDYAEFNKCISALMH